MIYHDVVYDRTSSGQRRFTCNTCKVQIVHQPYMTFKKWWLMASEFTLNHPRMPVEPIQEEGLKKASA